MEYIVYVVEIEFRKKYDERLITETLKREIDLGFGGMTLKNILRKSVQYYLIKYFKGYGG